jgi:putative ATPase
VPLAERMRPNTLSDLVGQSHLTGSNGILNKLVNGGMSPSLIFWGPPGSGKTTLAKILANAINLPVYLLSAINSGVKDVRDVIAKATENGKAVLFIDEIHRFNKSQQDSLLHAVESGTIILIGATTENPSFEVIRPLLSRSQVYILNSLTEEELSTLLNRAIQKDELLSKKKINIIETGQLFSLANGDARRMLNLLELVVQSQEGDQIIISDQIVLEIAQQQVAAYDKGGELHYDIISAFIKSIRGSDPNAALYWLARMTEGGEDPKFIARRLVILASEDIGNANPNALLIAMACFNAVEVIGYPECVINLSQAVVYLATSLKSNASYIAVKAAMIKVREFGNQPVPLHLRNAPTNLMKTLDYGKDYKYAHSYDGNFVVQEFLPDALAGFKFYEPGENVREREIRKFLKDKWNNKYNY